MLSNERAGHSTPGRAADDGRGAVVARQPRRADARREEARERVDGDDRRDGGGERSRGARARGAPGVAEEDEAVGEFQRAAAGVRDLRRPRWPRRRARPSRAGAPDAGRPRAVAAALA